MTGKGVNPTLGADGNTIAEAWQTLLGLQQAASIHRNAAGVQKNSISFTLITGFLGSGKTTLVNKLLTEQHGMRIAVIVNDFGSVNIDAALIERTGTESISLTNGCVCCTLTNGLVGTIASLVRREAPPDHIILEASGIAEPYAVIQTVLSHPALRLNGIVCVVDADRLIEDLDNASLEPIIRSQAAASDLIIVNKVDLVTAEDISAVRAWVAKTRPRANVITTCFGDVPAVVIVGVPARSAFSAELVDAKHSTIFETVTYTTEHILDDRRLRGLLANLPTGILRMKGFIRLASSPCEVSVLQSTASRWSIGKYPDAESPRSSEVVIVGLHSEFDPILTINQFKACEV